MIIQRLSEIQNRFGFLPDEELNRLARDSGVPLYRIEEVSTFFPAFRLERTNPPVVDVQVCCNMACHLRGAAELLDEATGLPALARELSAETGRPVRVEGVSCLGRCDRARVVRIERRFPRPDEPARVFTNRTLDEFRWLVRELATKPVGPAGDADADYQPHTNASCHYALPVVSPHERGGEPVAAGWSLDVYGQQNFPRDYRAIRRFTDYLASLDQPLRSPPVSVSGKELEAFVKKYHPLLWELKEAGLLGMGGAGAPAYQKWLDVWREPSEAGEKYIVCNGNTSEPGEFKDREILLRMPHLVVEGLVLAGLMTGAGAGFIAIRHDYPEQIAAIQTEIARAERLGACGENIFDSGQNFDIKVFNIPGGYICGEQSALLEVLEDRRAQPRNRPPELVTNGLYDRPTVVNNVETLSWVPDIMLRKGTQYAGSGWTVPKSPKPLRFRGRRLFSISGDVRRPGVYEVPIGLPLGDLIERPEYCGGVTGGELKAIAPSGPSGGFLPAKLPVDPKLDEKKRAQCVARIRERSAADADLMEWFLATHVPIGATHLDLLALPLDLTFFVLV